MYTPSHWAQPSSVAHYSRVVAMTARLQYTQGNVFECCATPWATARPRICSLGEVTDDVTGHVTGQILY